MLCKSLSLSLVNLQYLTLGLPLGTMLWIILITILKILLGLLSSLGVVWRCIPLNDLRYLKYLSVAGKPFKVSTYGTVYTITFCGRLLTCWRNSGKRFNNSFAYCIFNEDGSLYRRCNSCSLSQIKQAVILN